MNITFSFIYETLFGIFHPSYQEVFLALFHDGGYLKFGMIFIFTPLIFWALFYLVWSYPYGQKWHWALWLIIITIVVFGFTWGMANSAIFASNSQVLNKLLSDPTTGYQEYASSLPLKYALSNSLMSIIIGLIYSIVMKQFSKIQMHLPY